jgi:hypothetical protein
VNVRKSAWPSGNPIHERARGTDVYLRGALMSDRAEGLAVGAVLITTGRRVYPD